MCRVRNLKTDGRGAYREENGINKHTGVNIYNVCLFMFSSDSNVVRGAQTVYPVSALVLPKMITISHRQYSSTMR